MERKFDFEIRVSEIYYSLRLLFTYFANKTNFKFTSIIFLFKFTTFFLPLNVTAIETQ